MHLKRLVLVSLLAIMALLTAGMASPTSVLPQARLTITATDVSPAPIAYYPFDGNLNDASGNQHDGTTPGSIPFGSGIMGQAASFDRTTWMQTSIPEIPVGSAARTLCLWGKSATGQHAGNADHLANWGTASSGQAYGLMIFTGNTWWGYGHTYENYDTDSGVLADTDWHFICVTYDGAAMRMYVDGVRKNERQMILNTIGTTFYVGVRPDQTSDNMFAGLIDEVKIYNIVLTDQQIEEQYNATTGGTPLIVIPGIAGSLLQERGGDELWPGNFVTGHDKLTLDPENPLSRTDVIPTDIIRTVTTTINLGAIGLDIYTPVYAPLLTMLTDPTRGGYHEYQVRNDPSRRTASGCDMTQNTSDPAQKPSLFVFAYDWRKSNADNAQLLDDYVGCIRKFYGDAVKIDFLTHSMGGLIARRYELDHPSTVRKLVTIAAPWLGTSKAINVLETGEFFDDWVTQVRVGITKRQLKQLAAFFPGANQLLPSPTYLEIGGHPFGETASWDINRDGRITKDYTYTQLVDLLNTRFHSASGTTSSIFHDYPGQDDGRVKASNVQHVHIYGVRSQSDTIGTMRARKQVIRRRGSYETRYNFEITYIQGDKTVPSISAARSLDPSGVPGLNAANATIVLCTGPTDTDVEHGGLTRNAAVFDYLLSILRFRPQTRQECKVQTAEQAARGTVRPRLVPVVPSSAMPLVKPAYYLQATGAMSVTVTDAFGNSTDTISGTFSRPVPDVTTLLVGDDSHTLIVPTDQTYTITLRTALEGLALELTQGTGITATMAIRYQDVDIPAHVTAILSITPHGVDNLRYDGDGNGTFETIVSPTASVTGAMANDLEPPTITMQKTGLLDNLTVALMATDSGSGVAAIYYSLDGIHEQLYTGPFHVNTFQTPELYVFADDNVANRTGLITYHLAQSVYLPFTRR